MCIAGCRRDTNCPFGQVCVDVTSPNSHRVEKVNLEIQIFFKQLEFLYLMKISSGESIVFYNSI